MAAIAAVNLSEVQWKPYVALAVGIFVGSIGVIFIRNAQLEHIPTLAIAALRFILTFAVLTPFVLRRYRSQISQLGMRDFLLCALAGTMFAVAMSANFESLNHTSILISGVLAGSAPLWSALIEKAFLKVPLHRGVWIGLSVTMIGTVLISFSSMGGDISAGNRPLLGMSLSVIGAIFSAVYMIGGRYVRPHMSLLPYVWVVCGFASIASLGLVLLTHTPLVGYSDSGYFWVLLIMLGPQLIVQSSINFALAYIPATLVSLITRLSAVGNAVVALFAFNQIPLPIQIIGSAIVLAGVAFANIRSQS